METLCVTSPVTGASPITVPDSLQSGLAFVRQNSLAVEACFNNGIQKQVHVVVKNQPFLLQAALVGSSVAGYADLNKLGLQVRLLYDSEPLKEVDFVKMKPAEYKCHVNDRGTQVTVEARIKVLTSQLEDMLFRVKVCAIDPASNKPIDYLTAISDPIKVVSKPEQIKKKPKPICKPKENPAAIAAAHKRQADEMVMEALDAVDRRCDEQAEMLSSLSAVHTRQSSLLALALQQIQAQKEGSENSVSEALTSALANVASPTSSLSPPPGEEESDSPVRKQRKIAGSDSMQISSPIKVLVKGPSAADLFEAAFSGFMRSYERVSPDDLPQRIRKCALSLGARDTQALTQMLAQCAQACEEKKNSSLPLAPFTVSPQLPSIVPQVVPGKAREYTIKEEMEKIDQFYNSDFLALSSPAF